MALSLLLLGAAVGLIIAHRFGDFFTWGTYFLTFPLAFICDIIAHNHMHLGLFKRRCANDLFSLLLMFGSGLPPTRLVTTHNERHHRHMDEDKDFVRSSLVNFRQNWLNLLAFPIAGTIAVFRERPNDLKNWRSARPRLFRQAIRERILYNGALVALFFLDPRSTFLFCILPWSFAQLAMVAINLIQHQDCETKSRWNHSRNITSPIVNWFLLNNGFHTAHHNWPSAHWSDLSRMHRELVEPMIDPRLNFRTMSGAVLDRLATPRPS